MRPGSSTQGHRGPELLFDPLVALYLLARVAVKLSNKIIRSGRCPSIP